MTGPLSPEFPCATRDDVTSADVALRGQSFFWARTVPGSHQNVLAGLLSGFWIEGVKT